MIDRLAVPKGSICTSRSLVTVYMEECTFSNAIAFPYSTPPITTKGWSSSLNPKQFSFQR